MCKFTNVQIIEKKEKYFTFFNKFQRLSAKINHPKDKFIVSILLDKKFILCYTICIEWEECMNSTDVKIAPEALEVMQTYLQCFNATETAAALGVSLDVVNQHLNNKHVRGAINTALCDLGYANRYKLQSTLNDLIEKKLEELAESQTGSSKDIADLLDMAHKWRIADMRAETEKQKAETEQIKTQINTQVNIGTNYANLMEKLLKENV